MVTDERLDEIVKAIKAELKLEIDFGNNELYSNKRISTGLPALDNILGGGVVRRGITVLYGGESSGKSWLTLRLIASAQAQGLTCALVDTEYSYDRDWAALNGVDTEKLLIAQTSLGEKALNFVLGLVRQEVDLVVYDSIAQTLPEDEADTDMAKQFMGLQPRLMNKFFRKVPDANINSAIVMINQTRVAIGKPSPFPGYEPVSLPGGKGQYFVPKILAEIKRGPFLYNKGESKKTKQAPIGFTVKVETPKNKTSIPLQFCEIPAYFTGDIDIEAELFSVGISIGVIIQNGAFYTYSGVKIKGRNNFIEMLREDEDFYGRLTEEIDKVTGD